MLIQIKFSPTEDQATQVSTEVLITTGGAHRWRRLHVHQQNAAQTTVYDDFLIRGRKHACTTNHGDFNKPLGVLHPTDPRKHVYVPVVVGHGVSGLFGLGKMVRIRSPISCKHTHEQQENLEYRITAKHLLNTNRNPLADTDAETNVYCSRIALASMVELSGDYGVKEAW